MAQWSERGFVCAVGRWEWTPGRVKWKGRFGISHTGPAGNKSSVTTSCRMSLPLVPRALVNPVIPCLKESECQSKLLLSHPGR